jgi:hypothetical protein
MSQYKTGSSGINQEVAEPCMAAWQGQLQELQCSAEHDGRCTNNGHPQFVPQTEDNSRDEKN